MATNHLHERWAARAEAGLTEAGYRRGGARAEVIALLDEQNCALSAIEIEARLREGSGRPVARASVYRILEQLEDLALVTRVEVGQGLARFEAARDDHHHHHMVCDRCGRMQPFANEPLEQAIGAVASEVDFDVTRHDVVLHGVCGACRAA